MKYNTVEHLRNPNDLVMNTAQMRDAIYVQRYRINSQPLDVESVIQEGAARIIDARKTADLMSNEPTNSRGRQGRGRGRGASGRARLARGVTQNTERGRGG
jgi:hypothetical protein